ncbi:AAA-ATPase [Camellia lanceoleosa]|uniref:AAA-ATPase n=1 Tax=Camellia lanceoleosa TaxID=1840588 RepID=A0ACC0GFS2_9ERIC|nr:AAA-ATPase [Camellia lanceoleosa]
MDPELKRTVMDDLTRFVGEERVLQEGREGMEARVLVVRSSCGNTSLRNYLLSTANRSIITIEDIDCSVKLRDHDETQPNLSDTKLTLWGILNVIDGLWSSCGHERIFVFTTNHNDRLDPALLRPGRMDMHINMSYCTTHGFKILASNYLGIESHPLFGEIESLLENVEITPAEVAEQFMKSEDVDVCLRGLIKLLEKKIKSSEIKDENEGTVGIEEVKRPELDGKK